MDVHLASFKPRLIQLDPVIGIVGFSLKSLEVKVDGGVIILDFKGLFAGVIGLAALLGAARGENRDHKPDECVTPAAHHDSGNPTSTKLGLFSPLAVCDGVCHPANPPPCAPNSRPLTPSKF